MLHASPKYPQSFPAVSKNALTEQPVRRRYVLQQKMLTQQDRDKRLLDFRLLFMALEPPLHGIFRKQFGR